MSIAPIVYMVDDDPTVLKALARLLQSEGMTAITFSSPQAFLEQHDPAVPGCVVLDMGMPNLGGLDLQQALLASASERFVVFISGQADIASSVRAMKAGAVDFLTKPFEDEDFLAATRVAIEKDRAARDIRRQRHALHELVASLTPREYEVLQHVVSGRLNKQIASDLGIAEKTIKVHRARAMEKMGASSLAELVRLAVEARVENSGPRAQMPAVEPVRH